MTELWKQPVNILPFRNRELRALQRLKVSNLKEFKELDLKKVLMLPGYGRETYLKLKTIQEEIQTEGLNDKNILFADVLKRMSFRTRRVLKLLNITSFRELFNINENDIIKIPTFGTGTWHEIKLLQKKYIHLKIETEIDFLNIPANEQSIQALPLFSNRKSTLLDIDLHESYFPYLLLENISLPEWAVPYMNHLSLKTLGSLLLVPGNVLLDIQGFGNNKLIEIQKYIYKFLLLNLNHKQYYTQNANKELLKNFPFFNGIAQPHIEQCMIDNSYKPEQILDYLNLPIRAQNIFKKTNINTVGKLLITTPDTLCGLGNFGIESLNKTKCIISDFILEGHLKSDLLSNAQSLADILAKYIKIVLSKRSSLVILIRSGLLYGQPKTLEETAKELHLTRERIRQIQKKALSKLKIPINLTMLEDIRIVIEQIIKRSGGKIYINQVSSEIDKYFNWKIATNSDLVNFIIDLFDFTVEEDTLLLLDFSCYYCKRPIDVIRAEVPFDSEIAHKDISKKIALYCDEYNCKTFQENQISFSLAFIENVIKKFLSNEYICHDGIVCLKKYGLIKYGNKQEAIEGILKLSQKPLHFSEITKIYIDYCSSTNISEQSIHAVLGNIDNAILWDRGTYIHKDHIVFDQRLIEDVLDWIKMKLNNNVDFISIAGAYKHFHKRCNEFGIISESALYSYLRLQKKLPFFLNKYPFVSKTNQKISVQEFLENYILERDGEVPINEIIKLLKEYCFRNPLGSILTNLPNLLITDNNSIIHVENININLSKFHEICKYTHELLIDKDFINARKIFKDKIVSCKLIGITGPRLLFSCFQTFGQDYVVTGRYPQLKNINKKDVKGLGILNKYEQFIKQNGPCSQDELNHHFVEQLGYSERTIEVLSYYTNNILNYATGCYVHIDTLKWDFNKQKRLLNMLHDNYINRLKLGKYFARLKDILDYYYDGLQHIQNYIPWTNRLLYSLIEIEDSYIFIGNAKDAYVEISNESKILNLADLLYKIVFEKYDGAANKEELEGYLVKEGVLKKRLTANMLNNASNLTINGNYIIARELVDNV